MPAKKGALQIFFHKFDMLLVNTNGTMFLFITSFADIRVPAKFTD